jgi:hypothetical protein
VTRVLNAVCKKNGAGWRGFLGLRRVLLSPNFYSFIAKHTFINNSAFNTVLVYSRSINVRELTPFSFIVSVTSSSF